MLVDELAKNMQMGKQTDLILLDLSKAFDTVAHEKLLLKLHQYGENGLDPETSISLLQTYVLPVLFYGLEVVIPTGKSLNVLETQYKKNC